MVNVWYLPVVLTIGFVCGFFFYGCIDRNNDNWDK